MLRKRKTAVTAAHEDTSCAQAIAAVQANFAAATASGRPVFTTDAKGLFDLYLASLPADQRPHHTCIACWKFIETYGGLGTVTEGGVLCAAMWPDDGPEMYRAALQTMRYRIDSARITGVFLAKGHVWGLPSNLDRHNRVWEHFNVAAPEHLVWRDKLLTAGQRRAELRENYLNVQRALLEVPAEALDQALRVVEGEHVSRAEHFVGPVKWLRALQDRPKGRAGENLLWKAVATAPNGYCHPRSSVVWPLLEGILEGKSFETIKCQFEAMVAPLQYQRPQAPPSAGNVKQAEEMFAKLGLGPALERRFARLSDVLEFTWAAHNVYVVYRTHDGGPREFAGRAEERCAHGLFQHLETKSAKRPTAPTLDLPPITLTWERFKRDVLPTVDKLQVLVPALAGFYAFTAAVHADAPPILKWDRADRRNNVAWYTYPGGSFAGQWGVATGWVDVTAVVPWPTGWCEDGQDYLGRGELLVLEGCVDSKTGMGNALFPETLRGELHGVRSVIEAYSRKAELQGRAEAEVCGLAVRTGACNLKLRVYVNGQAQDYVVDRLE